MNGPEEAAERSEPMAHAAPQPELAPRRDDSAMFEGFAPRWTAREVGLVLAGFLALDVVAATLARGELTARYFALIAAVRLLGVGLGIVVLRGLAKARWSDLGWRPETAARCAMLGAASYVVVAPVVMLIQWLLTRWMPSRHPVETLLGADRSLATMAAVFVSTVIAAPLAEEFVFRVVLQPWIGGALARRRARALPYPEGNDCQPPLGNWATRWEPVFVVSAMFALMHAGQGPSPVPLFLFSLVLGFLYDRTRNIVAPLVLHMLLNGVSVLILLNLPATAPGP